MDLAGLEARIDLARRKGVTELHVSPDGTVRMILGPLPAAPAPTQPKAKQEDEPLHPADLVANPPELGPTPEPEAD
jgi:hypothetical protein